MKRATSDGDSSATGAWGTRRPRAVGLRQNTLDLAPRDVALTVALEHALAAVQRLHAALEVAARAHAEAAAHLARAQALAGTCATPSMRALSPRWAPR